MVAPNPRAALARAGAASDGSARPSCGECTPPIQSCSLPGVIAFASAAVRMRLWTWKSRAMAIQDSHSASSAWLFVT